MCVPWPPTKSPSAIYIYIYMFLSSPSPSLRFVHEIFPPASWLYFARELAKGTRDCCYWIIGFGRFLFFFLPFFSHLFSHLALMESRENIVYFVIYIYICTFENLHFGFGNWSLGRTATCLPFYSRFHLFSEEMKFPSDGDLFTFAYLK